MKTKVRCVSELYTIDSNLTSNGDIGCIEAYVMVKDRLCAIVIVKGEIKYCPIEGLEVIDYSL